MSMAYSQRNTINNNVNDMVSNIITKENNKN